MAATSISDAAHLDDAALSHEIEKAEKGLREGASRFAEIEAEKKQLKIEHKQTSLRLAGLKREQEERRTATMQVEETPVPQGQHEWNEFDTQGFLERAAKNSGGSSLIASRIQRDFDEQGEEMGMDSEDDMNEGDYAFFDENFRDTEVCEKRRRCFSLGSRTYTVVLREFRNEDEVDSILTVTEGERSLHWELNGSKKPESPLVRKLLDAWAAPPLEEVGDDPPAAKRAKVTEADTC